MNSLVIGSCACVYIYMYIFIDEDSLLCISDLAHVVVYITFLVDSCECCMDSLLTIYGFPTSSPCNSQHIAILSHICICVSYKLLLIYICVWYINKRTRKICSIDFSLFINIYIYMFPIDVRWFPYTFCIETHGVSIWLPICLLHCLTCRSPSECIPIGSALLGNVLFHGWPVKDSLVYTYIYIYINL